jgi:hypothetical protein
MNLDTKLLVDSDVAPPDVFVPSHGVVFYGDSGVEVPRTERYSEGTQLGNLLASS